MKVNKQIEAFGVKFLWKQWPKAMLIDEEIVGTLTAGSMSKNSVKYSIQGGAFPVMWMLVLISII